MWFNFHSHSNYCDGSGELADFLVAAKETNCFSVGFSSHAPLPFGCKWCMKKERLPSYLEEIGQLRYHHRDIEIYKSLEIDFIPGVISPGQYRDVLDYTIGSIHFADRFPDGRYWEIDNTREVFREGLEKIFNNDCKEAVRRYYSLTREMILTSPPDIIGHLDKIKMQNIDSNYFSESDPWYREEVLKTVDLIRQAELIVEVNTRGIYQKKTSTTYPGEWVLEIIREKNIPITLSSDAHHPKDLIRLFPETAELLQKIGFKTLTVKSEGVWKQLPFNENGIIRNAD